MLAGEGALIFARQIGFAQVPVESLISERERDRWQSAHAFIARNDLGSARIAFLRSLGMEREMSPLDGETVIAS